MFVKNPNLGADPNLGTLRYYYVIVIYTMLMSIPELKFIVPDETIFLILIEPIMKNPI